MSEYQEAHTVSSLKGSPPGYVGYGEGGVLTEAVRRKPYSVVLLDEVEKAHPDVMELFYQVFDKGMLEDGEGREIDFKNTVILLTSNVGHRHDHEALRRPRHAPRAGGLAEAIRPELIKVFKPALLGRMVVVPYYPISDDVMREIIKLQLGRIGKRLAENHGASSPTTSGRRRDRQPLQGGRERRAQRRPHPDAHLAAGDVRRVPVPDGERGSDRARPRLGGRERRFRYDIS